MKLIMESWKQFINEEKGERDAEVAAGGVAASQLLKLDLNQFVGALQSNQKGVIGSIIGGFKDGETGDDQVKIDGSAVVKCSDLRPTQNEVVFGKSIPFALERPKTFMEYLHGGTFAVGPPGNDAIVVLNGKWILDGHHRWSSLYCVNPDASMYAFNIILPVNPLNALKLIQASILAYAGGVPSNKGGGVNLFTIDENTLKAKVMELITPPLAVEYIQAGLLKDKANEDIEAGRAKRRARRGVGEAGKEQAVERRILQIYSTNVGRMQSQNKPAPGASSREVMPQTDKPAGSNVSAGGETPKALQPLEKGQVDFKPPYRVKETAAE